MKSISFLIKPASSFCNMNCRYCFYKDVVQYQTQKPSSVMHQDVARKLIDEALQDYTHITFAFQGGEPTLAGIDFFRDFVDYVNQKKGKQVIQYAIQTNGLQIQDKWCRFFKENHFLVGVSLDGYKENHDFLRPDRQGHTTYSQILKNMELLKKYQVDTNILMVLTSHLVRHPQKLFQHILKNKWQYVQLIPCLASLDQDQDTYALTPQLFASFYKTFFSLWFEQVQKGNYISITLFDNLILLFQNRIPQQCGMCGNCSFQYVVEANGNVYPCDFYALDTYYCGNVLKSSLEDMAQCKTAQAFIHEARRTCKACKTCPFISICHQNCKRLNVAYFDEEYCGYREFLEASADKITALANYFRG